MDKSYNSSKRKNYYKPRGGGSNNWNTKKFKNYLEPGMKGFLCTCNNYREKDCVKESYNILNEYADKLYGFNELKAKETEVEGSGDTAAIEDDIEDELKKEVSTLKSYQRNPHRFSTVDTGVKNNVFIKTTLENPVELAYAVLNDVYETKTQKGRFILRVVPIEATCKANLEDIKTVADKLFDKYFRCEPTTFAVVVNKRYNDSILRDEVIHSLALLVTDKNQEHKANLKDAKQTVLVEIMKGLCCLTVLEDYKRLRHYNLAELSKPDEPEKPTEETAGKEEKTEEEKEPDETGEEMDAQDDNEEPGGKEENQSDDTT